MPSRKQRRRREKLQRHEYEYVIETEEGEEVTVDRLTERDRKPADSKVQKPPTDRRGRPIQKPSFQRVMKRAAIFGPLLLILVFITSPSLTTGAKIANAILLLAIFIPFSYFVDVMLYRMFRRRQARQGGERRG